MSTDDDLMSGLVQAFSEPDDAELDAPEDVAADDIAEDDDPPFEEDDDDAVREEDEEGEEDATPEGRKTLTLLGPDGEPRRVPIDKLLAETMFDVEIDGKTEHVSYDELRKGYRRQADLTRSFQEVAETKKELAPYAAMVAHAKSDPAFVRHVQQYFQQGPRPDLAQAAQLEMDDGQIARLLDSERKEDVQRAKQILSSRAELRRTMAERQQVEQQTRAQQAEMLKAYLDTEREKVQSAIPDYATVAPAIAKTLQEEYGFNEAEINGVYDHRLVLLAADAMRYRQAQKDGSKLGLEAKRKPSLPPRAVKPGARKSATASEMRRSQQLTQRARKSGSNDDWAAVIASRLGL